MQAVAMTLLLTILGGGAVWAWRRQGRRLRWADWLEALAGHHPVRDGGRLKILDRIPAGGSSMLLWVELPDRSRMMLVIGASATVVHREDPQDETSRFFAEMG